MYLRSWSSLVTMSLTWSTELHQLPPFPSLMCPLSPLLSMKFCEDQLNYHSQEILSDNSTTSWIFLPQISSYIPVGWLLGTLGNIPRVNPLIDALFPEISSKACECYIVLADILGIYNGIYWMSTTDHVLQ